MYQIPGEIIGKKHNVISRWRIFTLQMITQIACKHSVSPVLVDTELTNENGRNLFHLVYDWRITRPAVQDDHFTYSTSHGCVVRQYRRRIPTTATLMILDLSIYSLHVQRVGQGQVSQPVQNSHHEPAYGYSRPTSLPGSLRISMSMSMPIIVVIGAEKNASHHLPFPARFLPNANPVRVGSIARSIDHHRYETRPYSVLVLGEKDEGWKTKLTTTTTSTTNRLSPPYPYPYYNSKNYISPHESTTYVSVLPIGDNATCDADTLTSLPMNPVFAATVAISGI
jgi:hypothetical protein